MKLGTLSAKLQKQKIRTIMEDELSQFFTDRNLPIAISHDSKKSESSLRFFTIEFIGINQDFDMNILKELETKLNYVTNFILFSKKSILVMKVGQIGN